MNYVPLLISGLMVASCAGPTYEKPLSVASLGGDYYVVGGAGCPDYQLTGPATITCYDENGAVRGTKSAVALKDLPSISHLIRDNNLRVQITNVQARLKHEQDLAELKQSLENLNSSSEKWSQSATALANNWQPPVATNPAGPSQSVITNCISTGSYLTCRTPADSSKFTCISSGSYYYCKVKS